MIDAAGGGKILAWQFSQTSYPPSFFIWQDNSNNIGIVVIGTQNASQMTGNILSAASQPYPGSGCEVHGYWLYGLQANRACDICGTSSRLVFVQRVGFGAFNGGSGRATSLSRYYQDLRSFVLPIYELRATEANDPRIAINTTQSVNPVASRR